MGKIILPIAMAACCRVLCLRENGGEGDGNDLLHDGSADAAEERVQPHRRGPFVGHSVSAPKAFKNTATLDAGGGA